MLSTHFPSGNWYVRFVFNWTLWGIRMFQLCIHLLSIRWTTGLRGRALINLHLLPFYNLIYFEEYFTSLIFVLFTSVDISKWPIFQNNVMASTQHRLSEIWRTTWKFWKCKDFRNVASIKMLHNFKNVAWLKMSLNKNAVIFKMLLW